MDKENFLKFLRETKCIRQSPKSQIGHIQLLEKFLQEEKDGIPLDKVTLKDLKEFMKWEKNSSSTSAQALVNGIRNYYRFLSKESLVKVTGELYAEYCEQQRQTSKRTWTERWLIGMVEGLDEHFDEGKRTKLMHTCGRACFNTPWHQAEFKRWKKLHEQSENLEDFLIKLERANPDWFRREGNVIHATFKFLDGCVCPIVKKIPHDVLSGTWCLCSAGLHKALFEETLERTVEVVLEESRRTGADSCRFRITLKN
jgi:predicted hydrocarbon binding protein